MAAPCAVPKRQVAGAAAVGVCVLLLANLLCLRWEKLGGLHLATILLSIPLAAVCGVWFVRGKAAPDMPERSAFRWLCALVVLYVLGFSLLNTALLNRGVIAHADLADFEQTVWNTTQGRFLESSIEAQYFEETIVRVHSFLAAHVSPILAVIALPYAVYPGTFWLFLFGQAALAVPALVLFRFARDKGLAPASCALAGVAWLLFPAIIAYRQFYVMILALPFIALAVLYYERSRLWPFALCSVLIMSVREDMAVTVGAFALVALAQRKPLRWVLAPLALCAVSLVLSYKVIMPAFGGTGLSHFQQPYFGGMSPLAWAWHMLGRPAELAGLAWHALCNAASPSAFLGLGNPLALVSGPSLGFNTLVTRDEVRTVVSHYTQRPALILLMAAIPAGLSLLRRADRDSVQRCVFPLWLLMCVIGLSWFGHFLGVTRHLVQVRPVRASLQQLRRVIPRDAVVAAPYTICAWFGPRRELYAQEFLTHEQWRRVDTVVFGYLGAPRAVPAKSRVAAQLRSVRHGSEWRVVYESPDILVFRRRARPATNNRATQQPNN